LPKNDEGEFELILGNRQLISVFVIVVVLLGVFFSMGYIVGRNSSPTAASAETARTEKPAADTKPPEPAGNDGSTSVEPADPTQPSDTPPTATPPSLTQPQKTQPEKPAAPAPKPAPSPSKQEVKPKPSPAHEAVAAPPRVADSNQPAGQYWQVVATMRPDAEIVAEALAKKGFHAVLSPAPKDGVFRVLVGPMADASTQAQTRTNLEAAGFKNPILRKY
jgi:outer membrane biosynthesis protein TonB